MSELVSVSEYAKANGKDPGNIRRLLLAGRIEGRKIGNQWVLLSDAVYPEDRRIKSGEYRNWRRRSAEKARIVLTRALAPMVRELSAIYGDKLHSIVLYGSYARGDETADSDVDIAVLLYDGVTDDMTDRMVDCVASHEIVTGKTLSVIEISYSKYEKWNKYLPFYKNIASVGIPLWSV